MHLDGKTNREIARDLKKSKDTINKYVKEYEENRRKLYEENPLIDREQIIESFVQKPLYDSSGRHATKMTDEVEEEIRKCLKENEDKRAKGLSKQQMKKIDITEYLNEQGYDVSYSSVKRAISRLEYTKHEAFIRQSYAAGDMCEFDWGTAKLNIGGTGYRKYQMAVFTSAKSNHRWAKLFMAQDTAAFQEAHAEYFAYTGGIFHVMVYDNMRVAVKKFVGISEKEPTEALLQLSLYYGFGYRFCNIYSGNEKGHVERSVEYVRRKAFSKPGKDRFRTLEEANEYLAGECIRLNNKKIYDGSVPALGMEEEKKCLLPAVPKFECCIKTENSVDKYSTVTVAGCHYSVPDRYVGKKVSVRLYTDKVIVRDSTQTIAHHARSYKRQDWVIELTHYLETFNKKPGALAGSTALLQADALIKNIYEGYYTGKERDFLQVLEIIRERGASRVLLAINRLETLMTKDFSAEKVRAVCESGPEKEVVPPGEDRLSRKAQSVLPQYDRAMKGMCAPESVAV